jgi:hypothetical protein
MTVERFDADCRNARAAMRTLREVAEEPVDYGEPDMVEEHEHLFDAALHKVMHFV